MAAKIVAALVAIALMLIYLGPMLIKMKSLALGSVILIGVVVMLVDLWHALRKSED